MYGLYRVAAAVPKLKLADVDYNTSAIIDLAKEAAVQNSAAVVFPELSITGYTCADLFHQHSLIESAENALFEIAEKTKQLKSVLVVGAPLTYCNRLYNCAVVIQAGNILGAVPKAFLPNYKEFYEKRWFDFWDDNNSDLELANGVVIPFGTDLIFQYDKYFSFAIEICEDLWHVVPPSNSHAVSGATAIFNLSASNELVAKADYRRSLVSGQSARCISAYVYASAGVHESTTDVVYSGHAMIAENGVIHKENKRFNREPELLISDIDCQRLFYTRLSESGFDNTKKFESYEFIKLSELPELKTINRFIDAHPFVPNDDSKRSERCEEIFYIQRAGLAKRFEHTGIKKAVIGISGGLDSTLALLVIEETFKLINKPMRDIITVTMPGFGTTDRTYGNAVEMCKILGTDFREVDIKDVCSIHFNDIGHDPAIHDVTYENVQARERTQILMDIANKECGLVIGTGDLSEIALGWSTYNGDHMSMYAVNCSVPKTLIRYLIGWVADISEDKLKNTLHDIIDTPVSPELLPNKKDSEINQKTEEILGPYELHDFYLYHIVKYGAPADKIVALAYEAFDGKYDKATITKYLTKFIKRFFTQQFKRSCIPDGPKVGTISLSPRGDWRMPSDANYTTWLKNI